MAKSSPTQFGWGSGGRASCMGTAVALLLSEAHEGQNQSGGVLAIQSPPAELGATQKVLCRLVVKHL